MSASVATNSAVLRAMALDQTAALPAKTSRMVPYVFPNAQSTSTLSAENASHVTSTASMDAVDL